MSTVLVAMLIAIVILAAVAAYGWLRPIETPPPAEVVTLEEKARLEGKVTIYGLIDTPDFVAKIKPAFELEYPWAAGMVEYVGFAPADLSSRALSEYQAGSVQADVFSCTLGSFMPALIGGVAENWTNPMISLMNYSTGTYEKNGQWGPGFQLTILLMYNTERLAILGYDPPATWEDLTAPKWNGLIALEEPKLLAPIGSLFAHLYPILGETAWTALMEGIAANNPVYTQSATEAYTKVSAGECALGIGLINDYLAGKAEGVPVEAVWIEPVTSLPIVTSLAKNAPHPNFAKLFYMWWASGAGQYSYVSAGRIPMYVPIATATILRGLVPSNITSIAAVASNNPDYYIHPSAWSDRYTAIFG